MSLQTTHKNADFIIKHHIMCVRALALFSQSMSQTGESNRTVVRGVDCKTEQKVIA